MDFSIERVIKELNHHRDKKIVLTSGVFDMMHEGHLWYLEECSKFGDILVVHVDGDDFVKIRKGNKRPIFNEKHRANLISTLKFVDYVYIENTERDSKEILTKIQPDYDIKIVRSEKSNEDRKDFIRKIKLINSKIKVIYLNPLEGISTTNILEKIYSLYRK